jgi:HIT domain
MSPFQEVPASEWVGENELAFAIFDRFPVSPGHSLVVTRRLINDWWSATEAEQWDRLHRELEHQVWACLPRSATRTRSAGTNRHRDALPRGAGTRRQSRLQHLEHRVHRRPPRTERALASLRKTKKTQCRPKSAKPPSHWIVHPTALSNQRPSQSRATRNTHFLQPTATRAAWKMSAGSSYVRRQRMRIGRSPVWLT